MLLNRKFRILRSTFRVVRPLKWQTSQLTDYTLMGFCIQLFFENELF